MNAELAVRIAGVLQLGLLSVAVVLPKKVEWRKELELLSPLVRHLFVTYAAYVVSMIAALGAVSLGLADRLVDGSMLARAVTAYIALFWTTRVGLHFFVFDVKPYITNRLYALGYYALTVTFVYLSATFLWVAFKT